MTKLSDRGIPILSMHEKLVALAYCIARDAHEDACGHLCDLLLHVGMKIDPSVGQKFTTLGQLVTYYGSDPTPIDDRPG